MNDSATWREDMKKTAKENQEHRHRAKLIANQMGKEYGDWFGFPEHSPVGRHLAIGEYIVELCEIDRHDEWFDAAKDAYLKWKETHNMTMTPPQSPNLKA
jgi:hypothetical protein